MNRLLLFFLLLSSLYQVNAASPLSGVLYNEKIPSPALIATLNHFGICHDSTWESILRETQSKWLRSPHQERWDFDSHVDPNPEKTYALFSELDMTQPIWNSQCEYTYAVILGATVQVMRQRFWFLKQAWEKGVRFKELIILVGDRPLVPALENAAALLESPYPIRPNWEPTGALPRNETEAAKLIFDQLDLPQEWRKMPHLFVDTPRPAGENRPRTSDTFLYWLQISPPTRGSFFIVSSQPFIGRQDSIARTYLSSLSEIDTVGEGFSLDFYKKMPQATSILLDELARWIYEERTSSFKRSPCVKER